MASKTKFEDISIEQYSERSVVVRGDTRKYKEDLKKLGGKYNSRLKGEPGWIFPKTKEGDVNIFIKQGQRLVSKEEAEAGEARSREWATKRNQERKSRTPQRSSNSSYPSHGETPTIGEYALLVNMLKDLSHKMVRMDRALSILLTPEQLEELEEKMKPPSKQKSHKKVVKRKKEKKIVIASDDSDSSSCDSGDEEEEGDEVEVVIVSDQEEEEAPRKRLL